MKSTLLTTTALVVLAGAASAEVTHALSGTLGYNDTVASTSDNEYGFYWEGNLQVTATQELDNGLTAGAYFEITIDGDNSTSADDFGQDLASSDFVLSLTSDTAGLYFGDTGVATKHWASAGDMEADAFTTDHDSAALRGDVSFGDVDASISYLIDDANDTVEQLAVGVSGSFGAFTFAAAYQEETAYADGNGDFNADEVFGISAGGTFGGATVTVAYASNETDSATSTGVKVAYPFGPVTATAYYVAEEGTGGDEPNYGVNVAYAEGAISGSVDYQDDQGTSKWAINAGYDLGNGIALFGGVENQNEGDDFDYHVGGTYDLGNGASLLVTYAADEDGDQADEIGSGDYQEGTTVEVSFTF
ncbi:porin [Yoonia tamlensis]|uniref:Porin n=1 Tax=Yoonia tamlensis TaxID=390270 RepID=A0A1I6HMK6_9RHOB|nr:porin [Yoonia tamlensis]SFR55628.1 porin [Yoonia tamlensis]